MITRLSQMNFILFILSNSFVSAEELQVPPTIIGVTNAIGFGVWKIYNAGEEVYFIDPDGERYLVANGTSVRSVTFIPSETANKAFWLRTSGVSDESGIASQEKTNANEGHNVKINGNLGDGRYSYGKIRFVVNGESISIFNIEDEDNLGNAVPNTVLNKKTNGLVHTGETSTSPFDATVMLNANNVPGPALVQGDCVATYSAETGHVEIPCLKIQDNEEIYRVGLEQIPSTLNFSVVPNSVVRVQ